MKSRALLPSHSVTIWLTVATAQGSTNASHMRTAITSLPFAPTFLLPQKDLLQDA